MAMTKSYVKDPNGKYKLVDRDQKVETKQLSLEELDARLKRVESIVIGPQK
jgi:proteasome assembly chaperone (PAC2) family protein